MLILETLRAKYGDSLLLHFGTEEEPRLVLIDGGPPGVYNLADDRPASQNRVIETACDLLGLRPPPLQSLDQAGLSPAARAFYSENRRVANGKAKRLLGWTPRYPDYRAGLMALHDL